MQPKRSRKILRSKSPRSINGLFHQHLTPNKPSNYNKVKISKKDIIKSPGVLNISKLSGSSTKSFLKSKSTQSLPHIPGNDLKIIKEIFTKSKMYRDKMNFQKIPVKIMPKAKLITPKPPRGRSIPKTKLSANSLNTMNYNIGKCKYWKLYSSFNNG